MKQKMAFEIYDRVMMAKERTDSLSAIETSKRCEQFERQNSCLLSRDSREDIIDEDFQKRVEIEKSEAMCKALISSAYDRLLESDNYVEKAKLGRWIDLFYDPKDDNSITTLKQFEHRLTHWNETFDLLVSLKKGTKLDLDKLANKRTLYMFVEMGGKEAIDAIKDCGVYKRMKDKISEKIERLSSDPQPKR